MRCTESRSGDSVGGVADYARCSGPFVFTEGSEGSCRLITRNITFPPLLVMSRNNFM